MSSDKVTIQLSAIDDTKTAIEQVKKNLKSVDNVANSTASAVSNITKALAPLASFTAIAAGIAKSMQLASDYQEAASKASVVFANNTKALKNSIDELTSAYGMNKLEATKAIAAMGDLFKPLGFAEESALKLSQTSVKLARDLASFNNLKTEDVLRDIQSALVGNTEAVRKYGVVLNEATIQQAAVQQGLNPKELTQAQKSYLILSQIINNNKDALGDYQRTQYSFANSMRTLQNIAVDVMQSFGQGIIETITPALPVIVSFAETLAETFKRTFSFVFSLIRNLLSVIITTAQNVLSIVDKLLTNILILARPVLQFLLNAILKIAQTIVNVVTSSYNAVASALRRVGINIKELNAQLNIENAKDSINNFFDTLEQKGSIAKTIFSDIAKEAEKTSNAANIALPALRDLKITTSAVSTASSAKASAAKEMTASAAGGDMLSMLAQKLLSSLQKYSQVFARVGDVITFVFDTIIARLAPILDRVLLPFLNIVENFLIVVGETLANLLDLLQPVFSALFELIVPVMSLIRNLLSLLQPFISMFYMIMLPSLLFIMKILTVVIKIIDTAFKILFNNVLRPLINVFIGAFNAVGGFFESIVNFVIDTINSVINKINDVLRFLRWNTIGTISRVSMGRIAEMGEYTGIGASATTTATTSALGGGGLSVQKERDVYVTFVNNGVLAGFANEDEFIAWIKSGLKLATERGL